MKTPSTQPTIYRTGDLLAPQDLNETFRFSQDALVDVGSRRWQHSVLTIPFALGPGAPATNLTAANLLTARFTLPTTGVLERAILSGSLTSSAGILVTISPGGTLFTVPAGTPTITGVTLDNYNETNPTRTTLTALTEYTITVAAIGGGTFTAGRLDLQLHLLVDRFTPATTNLSPSYSPVLLLDSDPPTANLVNGNITTLNTEAAKLASNLLAVQPILTTAYSFTSGTSTGLTTIPVMRADSSRAQMRVVAMYLRAEMATTGAASQAVVATLRDGVPGSTSLQTLTANVAGVLGATATFATGLNIPLTVATPGTITDYSVQFSTAGASVCARAHCILWVSR